MSRDGSGVYTKPFPSVVTGTTISSTMFNGNTDDVAQDLNTPRPIVAGGTGASDARNAMINLSGEIANQQVTNYDSHPFVSGSFWSAAGATSAPNASNAFAGICYVFDANSVTLEARLQGLPTPGNVKYVRQKTGGVWGAWVQGPGTLTDTDARYVNVTGDTMTGNLNIQSAAGAAIYLNKIVATVPNTLSGYLNGTPRWQVDLGDAAAESGGNAGSNFYVRRYSDAGSQIGLPIGIDRATGNITTQGNINTSNGAINCGTGSVSGGRLTATNDVMAYNITPTNGTVYFGNTGSNYLTYQGGVYSLVGGQFVVNTPNVTAGSGGATGTYYFGNSGTKYLSYDGTNFALSGGAFIIYGNTYVTAGNSLNVNGEIATGTSSTVGWLRFGNTDSKYLQYDGTNFNMSGGGLNVSTGDFHLQSSASSITPPAGYGMSMTYGGSTQWGFHLRVNSDGTNCLTFANAAGTLIGSISQNASNVAYNVSSSAELKEDLKSFDAGNIIDSTEVYDFKWRATGERSYGVLAQQAIDVYPTAVTHMINPQDKDDEFWGVDYSKYVPVLLQELKALRARMAELEGRVAAQPA